MDLLAGLDPSDAEVVLQKLRTLGSLRAESAV